ncbi:hypothetical protein OIV83_000014 [Microbotryomycetes sp. JL201]|nr:hypothetical protein OIV83_000014 [Microbotryomycetes sp. JL201]
MFSAFALFVAFLVGGITLVPTVIAVVLGLLFYTSPVVHLPGKTGIPTPQAISEDDAEPVSLYRAGWLTIRRTYEPLLESNGTYVGMITSGYRSFMDNRSRDARRSKPKEKFYAVLKQNILFLYDNEDQKDCWAAVEVSAHQVVIYPEGNLDGELFVKRNAIALKPVAGNSEKEFDMAEHHLSSLEKTNDMQTGKPWPWFLFARVNSDKEDWYHSLVQASKLSKPDTTSVLEKDKSLFDPDDMAALVDAIDQQPDSIPMRWFNALVGRIFMSVYRTSTLEEYITSRIVRKLKRVKTPSILSEIQVREVNVGSNSPLFTKPMLKELTSEGDASMEVHVSYFGEFRITIETVATINLGSRFKPYSVRLVLAVVLKELEGTLLLKVKKPPSNRVWFGFTAMPKMVLNVEPVVSTRQIKWSMITSPIESRIREVILESIVLPHMDDLSFFNSRPFSTRGGIWGDALRKERNINATAAVVGDEAVPVTDDLHGEPEDLEGELVPTVSDLKVGDAMTSAVTSNTARTRGRARTSSVGDDAASVKSMPARSSTASTTSSLSGFSLSSWRDTKSLKEATQNVVNGTGAGDKRRSWFGTSAKAGTAQSSSNGGRSSPAGTSTASTDLKSEDSATRLKDLLEKRARSRERERAKEEQERRQQVVLTADTGSTETSDVFGQVRTAAAPTPEQLSALSLTAPQKVASASTPELDSLSKEGFAVDVSETASLAASGPERSTIYSASPAESVEALVIPSSSTGSTSVSEPSQTSQSAPSSSSPLQEREDPIAGPPVATEKPRPPPVPSRPSFVKAETPPPPPRRPTHQVSQSVDSGSTATTASLLASWRTKAADKQALAAGVAQAKDTMKRWGANWQARRAAAAAAAAGEVDEFDPTTSPMQDGSSVVPGSSPAHAVEHGETYRDYRASKTNKTGDYYGSTSAPISVPGSSTSAAAVGGGRSRQVSSSGSPGTSPLGAGVVRNRTASLSSSPSSAGHFNPTAASPTTKLTTATTTFPSQPSMLTSSPPGGGGAGAMTGQQPRAYKAMTMMSIPGIRDESHRQAVARDHLAAGEKKQGNDRASQTSLTGPPVLPPRKDKEGSEKELEGLLKPDATTKEKGGQSAPPADPEPAQSSGAAESSNPKEDVLKTIDPANEPVAKHGKPVMKSDPSVEASPSILPPALPPRPDESGSEQSEIKSDLNQIAATSEQSPSSVVPSLGGSERQEEVSVQGARDDTADDEEGWGFDLTEPEDAQSDQLKQSQDSRVEI